MEIRSFTKNDEEGIRTLFALCFGREMSHEEWEWKYKHSPWGSYATVAVDGNEVVAHYGGIRNKFYFKGKTFYAYQFCDVMTHPQYRARLVSKTPLTAKLNEIFYSEQSMAIAYGFPSLRHARLQCLRLGGEGYRFVRLYKKESIERHIIHWKFRVKEGWKFSEDKEIENILARHDNISVGFDKNKAYLRWRYMENPVKTYQMLTFERLHVKKGYIVCALKDGWLNILDIFPGDYKEIKGILISLEDYALQNKMAGIKTWLHPNEPLSRHFEASGYISEDDIPITFRQVNKECGVKAQDFFESYYYRMGDYDAS